MSETKHQDLCHGRVANFHDFYLTYAGRALEPDAIALSRFNQRPCQWRYPANAAQGGIRLIYSNNGVSLLLPLGIAQGYCCAKKHLIVVTMLQRVDYFGDIQPLGKEADPPVDFPETTFTIDIVTIFRPVTIGGCPSNNLDDPRAFVLDELLKLFLETGIPCRCNVVARTGRDTQSRREVFLIVALTFANKRLAHSICPAFNQ